MPAELRRIVRSHQKAMLPLLFRAACYTLAKLCRDPRYLGGQIGALALLPDVKLPFIPKKKSWIVFAKPAVQGADTILKYLGRYVHRTAIGNGAIIARPRPDAPSSWQGRVADRFDLNQ